MPQARAQLLWPSSRRCRGIVTVTGRPCLEDRPGLCSALLDGLDLEQDLDRVADQDATRLQGYVPVEAEIAAVDRGLGGEPSHLQAPGIGAPAVDGRVQHDLAGGAANRQVADHAQPLL